MRRIALLSVMTFLAACGGSSSSGASGFIRVANLAPGVPSIDFCIAPTGGTVSAPVMSSSGSPEGIKYDLPGSSTAAGTKQVSKYFGYAPGTYDVKIMSTAAGGSCANPVATITGVTITDGGYKTIALEGIEGGQTVSGVSAALTARAFTDEVSVPSTSVALRFVNAGVQPVSATAFAPGLAFNIGYLAGTAYTSLFGNLAFPGIATGGVVDANGYLVIPSSGLPSSLTLSVCVYPFTPTNPPPVAAMCTTATVPAGSVQGGIVASAYLIGVEDGNPANAGALFCGDTLNGVLQFFGNYSACTSKL